MTLRCVLCAVLSCVALAGTQEVSLPETLQPHLSACYGTAIYASCGNHTDTVIAVKDVKVGAKQVDYSNAKGCPNVVESYSNGSLYDPFNRSYIVNAEDCCVPDETTDCVFSYNPIPSLSDYTYWKLCSGRYNCTKTTEVSWAPAASGTRCDTNNAYKDFTNYMYMEYYCISNARVGSICGTVSESTKGSALYLTNENYPDAISFSTTACTCSVQSNVCGTSISVYTVDMRLKAEGSLCKQSVTISSTNTNKTWDCTTQPYFNITSTTIDDNFLLVELTNSLSSDDGNVWLGFEVSDQSAVLTINCPASTEKTCITKPTTTPTPPTTPTPGGGGVDGVTTEDSSSLSVIIGVVVGLLILLAIIIIILCCCCCKKKKGSVVPEDEQETKNSDEINVFNKPATDLPLGIAPANTMFRRTLPPISGTGRKMSTTQFIMEHTATGMTFQNGTVVSNRLPSMDKLERHQTNNLHDTTVTVDNEEASHTKHKRHKTKRNRNREEQDRDVEFQNDNAVLISERLNANGRHEDKKRKKRKKRNKNKVLNEDMNNETTT